MVKEKNRIENEEKSPVENEKVILSWVGEKVREKVSQTLKDFEYPKMARQIQENQITVNPGEAIQPAISRLLSQGGGTLFLESGDYAIEEPLDVHSNLTIKGRGTDTLLRMKKGAWFTGAMIKNTKGGLHDLTIQDLVLDGNMDRKERTWTHYKDDPARALPLGILISDEQEMKNERIFISGLTILRARMGVHIRGAQDIILSDCNMLDNGSGVGYNHNCYLRRTERVLITDSKFTNSHSSNGLNLTSQNNVMVKDCFFGSNKNRGVRASVSRNVVFYRNTAVYNGLFGLGVIDEEGTVDSFLVADNLSIGNQHGLSVYGASNGLITGNRCYDSVESDLQIRDNLNVEII